jgi:hypothetical protein
VKKVASRCFAGVWMSEEWGPGSSGYLEDVPRVGKKENRDSDLAGGEEASAEQPVGSIQAETRGRKRGRSLGSPQPVLPRNRVRGKALISKPHCGLCLLTPPYPPSSPLCSFWAQMLLKASVSGTWDREEAPLLRTCLLLNQKKDSPE